MGADKIDNKFFKKMFDKLKNLFIFAVLVLFVFHNWAHLNDRLVIGGFFYLHLSGNTLSASFALVQIGRFRAIEYFY